MSEQQLTFSIIIPSYNEGDDIRLSVESALAQTIKPIEILVVDDSSDNTPNIIREYGARGVQLVSGEHKGCCGARNLGMRRAQGDVVVLLNGDVQLPPNFLERIKPHYEQGADYILVASRVLNPQDFLANFVQAQSDVNYDWRSDLEWTEGFSTRRAAAEKVDFIPGDFKIRFCRDWMLGYQLHKAGYKKVIDRSIVVFDRAPGTVGEYWRVRVARGRFSTLTQYYMFHRSRAYLAAKFIVKHVWRLLLIVTLIYPLIRSARLARHSEHAIKNILPFFWAYVLQDLARIVGEWQALFQIR